MKKKIIIITQQGSGSNLLRAFLNSHPDIYFAGELFCIRRDGGGEFQQSKMTEEGFLNNFFKSREAYREAIGFDLKYNQINDILLDYILNNGFSILHLFRDPARTIFREVNEGNKKSITYSHLQRHLKYVKKNRKKIFDKLKWVDYKEIYYEEMTRGKEITELPMDFEIDLLEWLEVEIRKLYLKPLTNEIELKIRF